MRSKLSLPLFYALFVGVGLLLLPFYRFELSPDAISYVSIATEYAHRAWSEAVNSYWSPLYSWLIAVLLFLRIPPIIAAKLITLAAALLAIIGLRRLSSLFAMRPAFQTLFLFVGAAMAMAFAFEENTPDLLFCALLLLYFGVIFDPDYPTRRNAGLFCGALGGAAYLAKAYGFFFFLAHFVLFTAIFLLRSDTRIQRTAIARHFAVGCLVFGLLSGLWSAVLHSKYGTWMTGTAGDYNFRLVGPNSTGYPYLRFLMPPSSEHAANSWQEPLLKSLPSWRITDGTDNIRHELKVLTRNIKLIGQFWYHTTPLWIACFLGYVVLSLTSGSRKLEWTDPLLTISLVFSGYVLLTVQARYFWVTAFLLLWITFRSLDALLKSGGLKPAAGKTLCWAVALSFLIAPVLGLRAHFLAGKNLYIWSQGLKRTAQMSGSVASCGHWGESAYVAYQLRLPYYGVISPTHEADETAHESNPDYHATTTTVPPEMPEIEAALSKAHISNLFIWPECELHIPSATEGIVRTGRLTLVRLNTGTNSRNGNREIK